MSSLKGKEKIVLFQDPVPGKKRKKKRKKKVCSPQTQEPRQVPVMMLGGGTSPHRRPTPHVLRSSDLPAFIENKVLHNCQLQTSRIVETESPELNRLRHRVRRLEAKVAEQELRLHQHMQDTGAVYYPPPQRSKVEKKHV